MTDPEIVIKNNVDKVYFGETFRPYGPGWVENGLKDYVSIEVISKVIAKNFKHKGLRDNYISINKDNLIKIVMKIYRKSDRHGKANIEKWVYAERYRSRKQSEFPFLKRLNDFYMFLRTGKGGYTIAIPPDVATKVAAQLTLTGIGDLEDVKSVLKVTICKRKEDWNVFDSLFSIWFESSGTAYGASKTKINPSSPYLHFESTLDDSVDNILIKVRKVISEHGMIYDNDSGNKLPGSDINNEWEEGEEEGEGKEPGEEEGERKEPGEEGKEPGEEGEEPGEEEGEGKEPGEEEEPDSMAKGGTGGA